MGRTPRDEAFELRWQIDRHDRLYYVEAAPEISDRQYDALLQRLRTLEEAHPELVTTDSPTQRVGGEPIAGFAKITHAVPMRSVDNTYDEAQLREFDERVRKALGEKPYRYVVDPKVDGVAASLRYERGVLTLAATRGDGVTGDDVTANVRTLRSVPLRLHGDDVPAVFEVRGEIYWPIEDFTRYNAQRKEAGEALFANPRNATAGTLKQLDPRNVVGRGLQFVAHGFGQVEPLPTDASFELFALARRWGIPTNPRTRVAETIDDVLAEVHALEQERRELPYDIDGLVAKVDSFAQRDLLGATSKYPRWCIAYKYAAEQGESVLRQVEFQVGKLGTITPRAIFDPVQLAGTTVRHASLHNFDQVERLDVRIGDTIIVEKAGEIIPQVVRVEVEKRPPGAVKIKPPSKCPVCEHDVQQDAGGVYLRCINPQCIAQRKERLIYFCGRDQMDIEGLGDVWIRQLVDDGLVTTFAELYSLDEQKLANLVTQGEFGEKKADEILADIQQAAGKSLARLEQVASERERISPTAQIPIAKSAVQKLAGRFQTLQTLFSASEADIQEVLGRTSWSLEPFCRFLNPGNRQDTVRVLLAMSSKGIVPIRNFGKTTIERLVDAGLVRRPKDLFGLHERRGELVSLKVPRKLGAKNANTIVKSLNESRGRPLSRVLASLNIRHVGASTAELVAEHFGDMESIARASSEDMQKVEGVGPEVAASLRQFFRRGSEGEKLWQALKNVGVKTPAPLRVVSDELPFSGKTIVVTGTLDSLGRRDAHGLIKSLGGKVTGSVSANTDFVVAGASPGSKLTKAKELDIEVIDEGEFLRRAGRQEA